MQRQRGLGEPMQGRRCLGEQMRGLEESRQGRRGLTAHRCRGGEGMGEHRRLLSNFF
jgi:hypothetical protein